MLSITDIGRLLGRRKAAPAGPPTGDRLPRHVAIIMDGNGRWARRRGLPRAAGHRAGMAAVKRAVKSCAEIGIEYLTIYAFSTENWARPEDEVGALMDLIVEFLRLELDELHRSRVRVRAIGDLPGLPVLQQRELRRAEELTRHNDGLRLLVALNYGGRQEIVAATRELARRAVNGELASEDICEETISSFLYTAGVPDPDLVIRTGGDMRLSNFLLWQAAYAELWVTPRYWPDFDRACLLEALQAYAERERRFGGLGDNSRKDPTSC